MKSNKKNRLKICFASFLILSFFFPQNFLSAAPQDVNGAGAVALDADGIVDGVTFTGQAVDETTLTVADGENINTNNNAAGVITDEDLKGNIQFSGDSTIQGTVGSALLRLNNVSINAGFDDRATFLGNVFFDTATIAGGSDMSFNANVTATSLNITDLNSGIIFNSNGTVIQTDITSAGASQGAINFGGNTTFTGNIGAVGFLMNNVIFEQSGSTSVTGNIFGSLVRLVSTGTTTVDGDITAGVADSLNYEDDHTLVLEDNSDITGTILITTNNTGTLTANGTSTIAGQVGTLANKLKAINSSADGEVATFSNDVFVSTVNIVGTGNTVFNGDLTGSVVYSANGNVDIADNQNFTGTMTTTTNDVGTVRSLGDVTFNGQLGTAALALNRVSVGEAGTVSQFNNDVYATLTELTNTGSLGLSGNLTGQLTFVANGLTEVAAGKNIVGAVTTTLNNQGRLFFLGSTTTGGSMGAVGAALSQVSFSGGTVSLLNDIHATAINIQANSIATALNDINLNGGVSLAHDATFDLGDNTITNSGTFTSGATTILKSTLNSATVFGNIASTGNAFISGGTTLNLNVVGALANGSSLKILDGAAGGTINSFSVLDNSARYSFSNLSSAGDLILGVTSNSLSVARTANNADVAQVLDGLATAGGDMGNVQTILSLIPDEKSLNDALTSMLPNISGANVQASLNAADNALNAVLVNPTNNSGDTGVASGDFGREPAVWMSGFGGTGKQDYRRGVDGYDFWNMGTALGYDFLATKEIRTGVAGTYGYTDVDGAGISHSKTGIHSSQGILYTNLAPANFKIDGAAGFGWNEYNGTRDILLGTTTRRAKADYSGQQYMTYLKAGYDFKLGKKEGLVLTPAASLQYTHLRLGSYTENGADSLNLNVRSQNYDVLKSGLGLEIARPWICPKTGNTLVPKISGKWIYDFIAEVVEMTSSFSGGGNSFHSNGAKPAPHSFVVGAELALLTKKHWDVTGNYNLEIKQNYRSQNGSVKAKYSF